MTKSREHGQNEVSEEANRRALREGKTVCQILAEMLKESKDAGDKEQERKVIKAQKYAGCRNKRKRRNNP